MRADTVRHAARIASASREADQHHQKRNSKDAMESTQHLEDLIEAETQAHPFATA